MPAITNTAVLISLEIFNLLYFLVGNKIRNKLIKAFQFAFDFKASSTVICTLSLKATIKALR